MPVTTPGAQVARIALLLRAAALMLAVMCGAASAPAQESHPDFGPAAAIVAELHGVLVNIMQNAGALGYQGRYQQVDPILRNRFDTPLIVKVILSRHWNGLNDAEKTEFIQLFHRLSVATYASRFDSFNGQAFVETGREQLNAGRILIKTELTRVDEPPVKLDYLIHQTDQGEWRIISVIANGVNDLSLKRAEYAAVIKERGFAGLLEDIRGKIHDMESGAET
ncbi:MAG: ABC transporter substrate-binding protein [Gammaproteobacteria bacterium]|nr:ABC transporter substrate-binding protein [Gammaproteobacteria bacterium]